MTAPLEDKSSNLDKLAARITNDPRFQRIKKRQSKIKIDSRFSGMLKAKNSEFSTRSKVDKYGRKIKNSTTGSFDAKELKRIYEHSTEEEEEASTDSQSPSESDLSAHTSSDDESDDETSEYSSAAKQAAEISLEHPLALKNVQYAEARYRRLAVCNLEWDFVKAFDILKLLDSFKPAGGYIVDVKIYISEFGKSRVDIENTQGPMLEKSLLSSTHKVSDDAEQEDAAAQLVLKKYALDKLRYFFAVVACDSVATASAIYDACDGVEFEKSSNFVDLRFVPDDVTFEEEDVRDTASDVSAIAAYTPKEFSSSTLQNSRQKLKWDEDDYDRVKVTKTAAAAAAKDIDDACFDAYLASDVSEDESRADVYKRLLSSYDPATDPFAKPSIEDVDMEITFTAGLGDVASDLLKKRQEKEQQNAETPFETVLRKQKEKRKEKRHVLKKLHEKESTSDGADSDDEARSRRRHKSAKKRADYDDDEGPEVSFKVNAEDERFGAIYKSSDFAIDPTNSAFKKTDGMREILAKKRRTSQPPQ